VLEPRRVELGVAPAPAIDPAPLESPSTFDDLPLRSDDDVLHEDLQEPVEEVDADELAAPPAFLGGPRRESVLAGTGAAGVGPDVDEADYGDDDDAWELDLEPPARAREGVERPAGLGDRALAAALDAVLLGALYSVVVYFASRAAQSTPAALTAAWPWLAAYMLLLGLAYAGCFTGFTGQTPGKMWAGLRVVDGSGRAPGVWYAVLRAGAAVVGIAVLGAGLIPIFLDPARRAAHDRLLGTRVVTR